MVPTDLQFVRGDSWFRDDINQKIQEITQATPTQGQILFFATEEMLSTLENARELGTDATFDLSSQDFKVLNL